MLLRRVLCGFALVLTLGVTLPAAAEGPASSGEVWAWLGALRGRVVEVIAGLTGTGIGPLGSSAQDAKEGSRGSFSNPLDGAQSKSEAATATGTTNTLDPDLDVFRGAYIDPLGSVATTLGGGS